MGLILCKTKESKKPYIIKNVSQSVYSLEELSYYIYNNVYLIGPDLIEDTLIEYISTELGEEKLANSLRILVARKANLSDFVVSILRYVDYYSVSEINRLREIIDSMNSKNVLERIGARADNFLKNNCCHSAIKNYDKIINSQKDDTLPDVFYASIHHNMGVAYAKLFMYQAAYECFMNAYEISANEESKRQAYVAAILYKNQNGKELATLTEEDQYVISHEIEMLMNNAVLEEEYSQIREAFEQEILGNVAEYYDRVNVILGDFQNGYKELCN